MPDIQERIQRAIELHNQGVNSSSTEFQMLTMKIKNVEDCKLIRSAFYTGVNPLEKQLEKKAEEETAVEDDLSQAIMNNSSRQRSAIVKQVNPPSGSACKTHIKMNEPQSFDYIKPDQKYPEQWHFAGVDPVTFGGCMYRYCLTSFWEKPCDAFQQIANKIRRNFPHGEAAIQAADRWLEPALKYYMAYQTGSRDSALLQKIKQLGGPLEFVIKRNEERKKEQRQKTEAQKKHVVAIANMQKSAAVPAAGSGNFSLPQLQTEPHASLPLVYMRHQNDITGLAPCNSWTLLVDESGNSDTGAFETGGSADGIIAGVLFPTEKPLASPLYPELHASTDSDEARIAAGDKLIENMLNSSNCGVIALPVKALRSSRDWGGAIGLLIDLVLRLLPVDGKTSLQVLVENKDAYDSSEDFAFLRDACYYQLMQSLPDRSEKIKLSVDVMKKDYIYNAYPDFVANTCFARSKLARQRLQITGWGKTCFLNYSPAELARLLDFYYTGKNIRPEDWKALLMYDGMSGRNFISGILDSFGNELKQNISDWEIYLRYTIDHLNSKAIQLPVLEKQISYLMNYQPEDKLLPPRLNLLWLTSRLANKNHHGELITEEEERMFRNLIRTMYPEDAQLACWTTLHLAVAMTDSFDFSRAKQIIRNYYDVRKYMDDPEQRLLQGDESRFAVTPMVIPGQNYFAQMLSSYGQHEAFTGNMQSSVAYFRKALELFDKLSDDTEGRKQTGHTLAYLVLALMDMPSMRKEFLTEFEHYFSKTPLYAVKDYVSNTDAPYYHHILVRALADHQFPAQAERAYLAASANWQHETWHPWELIEFYRGVLSKSLSDKIKYMRSGYELAMQDGGTTLRMIGCAILGALYFHDQSVRNELESLTERMIVELPKLGSVRVAAMKRQITEPVEPMTYIKKILPFNFR